jgi:putative hydrolase of the HAD superfamily
MAKERIKNIIFDLGGVILNLNYENTSEAFKRLGVGQFDQCYSQAQQTGLFDDYETGKIDETTFFKRLNELSGSALPYEKAKAAWNAMLLDFPLARLRLLEELGQNHRLFLLSNTNATHQAAFEIILQEAVGHSNLNPWFEQVYFSHHIGLRKPNAAVFQWVLEQNDLKAGETLFIDDSEQHVVGARSVGIQAKLLKPGTMIEQEIKEWL